MTENYSVLVAAPETVFISLGIFEAEDDEDARIKLGDFIRERAEELRPEDVIHLSKDEGASEICPPSMVAEYLSPSI
jgi:hypothetical protein